MKQASRRCASQILPLVSQTAFLQKVLIMKSKQNYIPIVSFRIALFLSSVFYLFLACSNYLPDLGCSIIKETDQCNRLFPLCRKTCLKCPGKYDVTSEPAIVQGKCIILV